MTHNYNRNTLQKREFWYQCVLFRCIIYNSTHNSDTSLTVITGVVLGRFDRTAQVPLARYTPMKNLRYLL